MIFEIFVNVVKGNYNFDFDFLNQVALVDALVSGGDEGRYSLR